MFGFCIGHDPFKKKSPCHYKCKTCGDIWHMDDLTRHLYAEHDWPGGNFDEVLDEYDRLISFKRERK